MKKDKFDIVFHLKTKRMEQTFLDIVNDENI